MRICAVSFVGPTGVKHSVEVQAESLYEAAVEGIRAISEHWGQEPALITPIIVEVRPQTVVAHEVTLRQIRSWLESTSPSPKDKLVKEHLKERLSSLG